MSSLYWLGLGIAIGADVTLWWWVVKYRSTIAELKEQVTDDMTRIKELRMECLYLTEHVRRMNGGKRMPPARVLFDEPLYCEKCNEELSNE